MLSALFGSISQRGGRLIPPTCVSSSEVSIGNMTVTCGVKRSFHRWFRKMLFLEHPQRVTMSANEFWLVPSDPSEVHLQASRVLSVGSYGPEHFQNLKPITHHTLHHIATNRLDRKPSELFRLSGVQVAPFADLPKMAESLFMPQWGFIVLVCYWNEPIGVTLPAVAKYFAEYMLQIRIYMRSCVTSVKRMMLCLCFISAVLFLMLYVIENTQLKLKLLESVKENARILRIGRRFEQELKERNDNTQILPALYAEAQGVNTSTQLNRCRANVRPKVYVVCNGPFGFVRAPLFHARVVAW